jgi:hypothetical protein
MSSYPNSSRATLLKSSLKYAERGKPVFPCEPGGKKPLIKDWPNEASTDPRKIHMWGNRWPNANIGIPTGERGGILVVDHDTYKEDAATLEEIEAKLGPISTTGVTIETGNGGRQYAFRYPLGSGIRNTTNLLPGVDVRGEGGYVIATPSVTSGPYRRLDNRTLVNPPERLTEALTRPQSAGGEVRSITTAPSVAADGPSIPQGSRDDGLTRIAGRLHDGTRSLDNLTAELLEINAARCEPPLPDSQVLKVARSIHRREPCRSGRPKEVDELVEALSEFWHHGRHWHGIAEKSEARFVRALIREGRKVGTAIPTGLRIEKSFRQMAEILGTHRNTITNIVRRGKAAGWLRQDNADRSGVQSGAFVLVDPRRICDTFNHPQRVDASVTSSSRPVAGLSTPHYRHRGPVGYSREHTLCVLEAHGPQSRESAAELLGWSRSRDLERLHLDYLVGRGLLEKRGELYAVPGEAGELGETVRSEPYSTVQARVRRVRSVEGLYVHVVGESGIEASEVERARLDREKHERERQAYRGGVESDAHYVNVGADGYIGDLRPVEEPDQHDPVISSLAEAVRDYLDKNPSDARQSPYWIGTTLWCYDLFDGKPTVEETVAAIEELGGAAYLEEILKRARGAA